MSDSSMLAGDAANHSRLPKLDREPLARLIFARTGALDAAAQRIRNEASERTGNFAAFGNAP